MDFERIWYSVKKTARRVYKKIRKVFRKIVRWLRRYIRLLIRHTKAKDYSVLIYTVLAVIAFILVIVLFGKLFSAIGGGKKDKKDKKPSTEIQTPADSTEDPAVVQARQIKEQCSVIYENNKDYMILVNHNNPLPEGYTFEHHTLNCGLDVDERIYPDLLAMLSDLNAQDLHYTVVSAYRSRETQQSIVNDNIQNYIAQGMTEEEALSKTLETVQAAGYSEHETGLALDLVPEGRSSLDESIETDPVMQWFAQNSYKYGFVIRYPTTKADITGISYEPWHFRYVGVEAAVFLYNNNLTLEEFYDLLNN